MHNKTTEFSFLLKPAEYGIGVFAAHDIAKGTYLRIMGDESIDTDFSVRRKKEDVPEQFQHLCEHQENELICPADFGRMEVGWYLNHSHTPNAYHKNHDYYALRDIKEGEEITIDYNILGEPEHMKDDFYKK